jgi:guanylate kinase
MSHRAKKIIIIAAPSGSGKTSVVRHLLKTLPEQVAFSISATTRQPRNYEVDKVDYYFLPVDEFKQRIQDEEFVEWEMVYEGKYYGTLKSELHRIWEEGKTPLLDVDVQGGIHVQQQFPDSSLSLFIEPPSIEELERRLQARGTETPGSLQARINKAAFELSFKSQFNRIIVNDKLENTFREAEEIVRKFLDS